MSHSSSRACTQVVGMRIVRPRPTDGISPRLTDSYTAFFPMPKIFATSTGESVGFLGIVISYSLLSSFFLVISFAFYSGLRKTYPAGNVSSTLWA